MVGIDHLSVLIVGYLRNETLSLVFQMLFSFVPHILDFITSPKLESYVYQP